MPRTTPAWSVESLEQRLSKLTTVEERMNVRRLHWERELSLPERLHRAGQALMAQERSHG